MLNLVDKYSFKLVDRAGKPAERSAVPAVVVRSFSFASAILFAEPKPSC